MRLGNPIDVAPGVFQIRTIGARVTVLTGGGDVTLVDAGAIGSLGTITSGLRALDLFLEQVTLIVLTHYHPDHSGGLGKLVEATSAKVAVHSAEAEIIRGDEPAPSPHTNPMIARLTGPILGPLLYGTPVKVDYSLEDGQLLPVGEETRVVHTPGHTAGSICLYLTAKKVLIVGDALQYRLRRLRPPAESVTKDSRQARESLRRLVDLDIGTICFSHFSPLRQNPGQALRKLVEQTTPVT